MSRRHGVTPRHPPGKKNSFLVSRRHGGTAPRLRHKSLSTRNVTPSRRHGVTPPRPPAKRISGPWSLPFQVYGQWSMVSLPVDSPFVPFVPFAPFAPFAPEHSRLKKLTPFRRPFRSLTPCPVVLWSRHFASVTSKFSRVYRHVTDRLCKIHRFYRPSLDVTFMLRPCYG